MGLPLYNKVNLSFETTALATYSHTIYSLMFYNTEANELWWY